MKESAREKLYHLYFVRVKEKEAVGQSEFLTYCVTNQKIQTDPLPGAREKNCLTQSRGEKRHRGHRGHRGHRERQNTEETKTEQEFGRSPEKIFQPREVFNTRVENFVQKRPYGRVNPPFFNGLMRFAQNLCNKAAARAIFVTMNTGERRSALFGAATAEKNIFSQIFLLLSRFSR